MDYLINYDEINSKWLSCEKELITNIGNALSTVQIQFSRVYNDYVQSKHGMALNNMNLRFIEIYPEVLGDEKWKNNWNWYQNKADVEKVSDIFNRIVNNYGFQFMGIETQDNGIPLFVVKLAE